MESTSKGHLSKQKQKPCRGHQGVQGFNNVGGTTYASQNKNKQKNRRGQQ